MSYANCRSQIATVLEAVSITSPIAQTLRRVYTDPPGSITDLPCAVLYGSSGSSGWAMGGTQTQEEHTERVRLLVSDADLDQAAALVRAYRAAIITAFVSGGGLGGNGVISGFTWEEPASFNYGGRDLTGEDVLISFVTTP